ncbi:MAG: phage tail tape measure protein [Oscillospiraceae bacterium]
MSNQIQGIPTLKDVSSSIQASSNYAKALDERMALVGTSTAMLQTKYKLVNDEIGEVKIKLDMLNQEQRELNESSNVGTRAWTTQMNNLNATIIRTKNDVSLLEKEGKELNATLKGTPTLKNLSASMQATKGNIDSVNAALKETPKSLDLVVRKSQLLEENLKQAKDKVKLLTEEQKKLANSKGVANKADEMNRYEKEIRETTTEITKLQSKIASVSKLKTQISNPFSVFKSNLMEIAKDNSFARLGGQVDSVGKKIFDSGQSIYYLGSRLQTLSVPAGLLTAFSVKSIAGYDDELRKVLAITEASAEEYARLDKAAKLAGDTTRYTSAESATALGNLASAGFNVNQSITALPQVLNLASAGVLSLDEASDMGASALKQWGLEVSDLTMLTDQWAKAASISNAEIRDLTEANITAGGVARGFKQNMADTNAVLAVLADNGRKGTEAGTNLRSMMLSLFTPTDKAKERLDMLGVAAYDAEGNAKGLKNIFEELRIATKDMNDEQKNTSLREIFDERDINAVNILLGTTTEKVNDYASQIENSKGATQKFADTLEGGIGGELRVFKSLLESIVLDLGNALIPTVQAVGGVIKNAQKWFKSLNQEQVNLVVKALLAATALAPLIKGFSFLLTTVGATTRVIGLSVKTFGLVTSAIKAYGLAQGGLTLAQNGMATGASTAAKNAGLVGKALSSANPYVIAATLVIGGLVAAYVLLDKKQNNTVKNAKKVGEDVSKAITSVDYSTFENKTNTAISGVIDSVHEMDKVIVSSSGIKNLEEKFTSGVDNIKTKLGELKGEQITITSKALKIAGFSPEEIDKTVNAIEETYTGAENKIQIAEDAIQNIIKVAQDENRELRKEELEAIKTHYADIAKAALEVELEGKSGTLDYALEKEMQTGGITDPKVQKELLEQARLVVVDKAKLITEEYANMYSSIQYLRDDSASGGEKYVNAVKRLQEDEVAAIGKANTEIARVLLATNDAVGQGAKVWIDANGQVQSNSALLSENQRIAVEGIVEEINKLPEAYRESSVNALTELGIGQANAEEQELLHQERLKILKEQGAADIVNVALNAGDEKAVLEQKYNTLTEAEKIELDKQAVARLEKVKTDGYNAGTTSVEEMAKGMVEGTPYIEGAAVSIADQTKKKLGEASNSFGGAVNGWASAIGQELAKGEPSISAKGSTYTQKFADGLELGKPGVSRTAGGIAAEATNPLKNSSTSTHGLGVDFGNGFSSGIASTAISVATSAVNIAAGAIQAVKNKQQSNSPSKVAMRLGNDYGVGYSLGITSTSNVVQKSARNIVEVAVNTLKELPIAYRDIAKSMTEVDLFKTSSKFKLENLKNAKEQALGLATSEEMKEKIKDYYDEMIREEELNLKRRSDLMSKEKSIENYIEQYKRDIEWLKAMGREGEVPIYEEYIKKLEQQLKLMKEEYEYRWNLEDKNYDFIKEDMDKMQALIDKNDKELKEKQNKFLGISFFDVLDKNFDFITGSVDKAIEEYKKIQQELLPKLNEAVNGIINPTLTQQVQLRNDAVPVVNNVNPIFNISGVDDPVKLARIVADAMDKLLGGKK